LNSTKKEKKKSKNKLGAIGKKSTLFCAKWKHFWISCVFLEQALLF